MRPGKPSARSQVVVAILLPVALVVAILAGCGGDSESPPPQGDLVRSAALDNTQEFPPTSSAARATGIVSLNPVTHRISAVVVASGVDNVTEVHLHIGAPAAPIGSVVLGLARLDNAANVWTAQDNSAATDNVVALFNQGNLCFNIHTTQNPAGEIRGQVLAQSAPILTATLSGAQEVPPVAGATHGGRAAFGLVEGAAKVIAGAAAITGADNVTEVHVHAGARGTNGEGVPIDNLVRVAGTGIWATHPAAVIPDNVAVLLQAGGLYVHAHTAAHPAGEIRGQIDARPTSTFRLP